MDCRLAYHFVVPGLFLYWDMHAKSSAIRQLAIAAAVPILTVGCRAQQGPSLLVPFFTRLAVFCQASLSFPRDRHPSSIL